MFYLMMQSTHIIYGYKVLEIWLRITATITEEPADTTSISTISS